MKGNRKKKNRNPVAQVLRLSVFRKRITQTEKIYNRKKEKWHAGQKSVSRD